MKAIVDLCVCRWVSACPVSQYVVACDANPEGGRPSDATPCYGTNIEGEWDAVFAAIKRCHETVHAMAPPASRR